MRQKNEKVQIQTVLVNWKNQYWKKVGDNLPKRIPKGEYWALYDKSFRYSGHYIEVLPPITKE